MIYTGYLPPGPLQTLPSEVHLMPHLPRRTFLQTAAALLPSALLPAPLRADDSPPITPPKPLHREEDRYGIKRALPNGTSTFKISTKDCRGDFFAMEHLHTAKGGPPRHLHHVEDEFFYVLEGEYRVEVAGQLHTLHAGDSLLGPRGIPHAFAFVGSTPGRLLITYAPAGRMEEFFNVQDQHGGRVYGTDIIRAYGMERVGPPLAID